MRTFRKREQSVLKKMLLKKLKVRVNVVGSANVPRQRQRKLPQTTQSRVGSARAL